jgi:phospholipid/cholesterol/gamma-HCH transport system substrate-binding protein
VRRALREHRVDFLAILGLIAIATACSVYILNEQRLRFPIIEDAPFRLQGEFSTGQAVTPGQGQTVRVSGVRVGDITKVELENGRAIITMDLDREHEGLVRENWTGLLRPKTGLKDMFIELTPGRGPAPRAREGWRMPIASTLPDVNPDEFLSSLDADTRDYLKLLLSGARGGLEERSGDLNAVLKRFEPTYRDIARVSGEVAGRREDLKRLINSLDRLNTELGRKDDELAQLVDASATVFRQFSAERGNVAATVRELPSALAQTTDTLGKVETMAEVLAPASERLRPAVRALERANRSTRPFAREVEPLLREDIRPFVRELRPLVRELDPAAADLAEADPTLKRTVHQLNRLFNLLAFNPGGREGPDDEDREEGYLFHLAWLSHQSVSLFGGQDANGIFRPLVLGGACNVLLNTAQSAPESEFLLGLSGVLNDPAICGGELAP